MTAELAPECSLGPDCNDIDDIAHTERGYVAVTHPTMGVWTSEDLRRWVRRDPGLPENGTGLWSILATHELVLVGGGGGKLAVSYDEGESWRPVDPGFGEHGIWATAYGSGVYLIAGDWGAVGTTRHR